MVWPGISTEQNIPSTSGSPPESSLDISLAVILTATVRVRVCGSNSTTLWSVPCRPGPSGSSVHRMLHRTGTSPLNQPEALFELSPLKRSHLRASLPASGTLISRTSSFASVTTLLPAATYCPCSMETCLILPVNGARISQRSSLVCASFSLARAALKMYFCSAILIG